MSSLLGRQKQWFSIDSRLIARVCARLAAHVRLLSAWTQMAAHATSSESGAATSSSEREEASEHEEEESGDSDIEVRPSCGAMLVRVQP